MNVKSFENDSGILVNVDLDLVDMVSELPDGRAVLQFGGESVFMRGAYSEIAPQVTAIRAVRSPLPPLQPPKGASGEEGVPPHTEEPPPADNANNGGGETAAADAPNP